MRKALLAAAAALALSTSAVAQPITVNNFSFENPVTAPATFTGGTAFGPTGWSVYNAGETNDFRYFGVWNPATTTSYLDPIHGANVGVAFLMNDFNIAEAGLQQTLTATLQAGTQYTLRVEIGNFAPQPGPFDFAGFPGYRVDLMAGTTVLASDPNTLAPGEGRLLTSTVEYAAFAGNPNLGQSLRIRLVNLNGPGTEVNFDNVRLDAAPVPEPATLGFFAAGAVLLMRTARRRVTSRYEPPA